MKQIKRNNLVLIIVVVVVLAFNFAALLISAADGGSEGQTNTFGSPLNEAYAIALQTDGKPTGAGFANVGSRTGFLPARHGVAPPQTATPSPTPACTYGVTNTNDA